VAAFVWNGWQLSCGTGGSFRVESVAGLYRFNNMGHS
jgi:hypothetical protein